MGGEEKTGTRELLRAENDTVTQQAVMAGTQQGRLRKGQELNSWTKYSTTAYDLGGTRDLLALHVRRGTAEASSGEMNLRLSGRW